MAHKPRKEMIAETRAKLVSAARHAFGTVGYTEASMDDFTAAAGLTRGALYHHFGDKKGLLQAVIAEIDAEMAVRIREVAEKAPTRWQRFVDECTSYIEMALEPEIQRIMFRDGPAVLGDPSQWPNANACEASTAENLTRLQERGRGRPRSRPGHGSAVDQWGKQSGRAVDRKFRRSRSNLAQGCYCLQDPA